MRYGRIVLVVGLLLLVGTEARAQAVSGQVLDAATRAAIGDAIVTLVDGNGRQADETVTNAEGRFSVESVSGPYQLAIQHVGYQQLHSQPFVLSDAQTVTVEVLMDPTPHTLGNVTVTDSHVPRAMERSGHYVRRRGGAGRHISREDIERRAPRFLTDMLEGIPGLAVVDGDIRSTSLAGHQRCVPTIILDNVPVRKNGQAMGVRLDDVIRPERVEAMEVYPRGNGLPAQFAGRVSPCGAVLIWQRR